MYICYSSTCTEFIWKEMISSRNNNLIKVILYNMSIRYEYSIGEEFHINSVSNDIITNIIIIWFLKGPNFTNFQIMGI